MPPTSTSSICSAARSAGNRTASGRWPRRSTTTACASGSPPRSACRPPRARFTRSTRACARRARRGRSRSASRASRAISASDAWTWEHMALTRARPRLRPARGARRAAADHRRDPAAGPRPGATARRRAQDARRDGRGTRSRRAARRQAAARRPGRLRIPRPFPATARTERPLAGPRRGHRCAGRGWTSCRSEFRRDYDLLTRLLVAARLLAPDPATAEGRGTGAGLCLPRRRLPRALAEPARGAARRRHNLGRDIRRNTGGLT